MKTTALFTLALIPALALTLSASAQDAGASGAHVMVKASDTKWGDGPAFLPKGVQAAVLYGDPAKSGPFAIRLKAPAGGKIPRHWHPTDEQVTLLDGDATVQMNDGAQKQTFSHGAFVLLPAQMHHAVATKGGMTVQVAAMGPFELTYVDPKDDPRKRAH